MLHLGRASDMDMHRLLADRHKFMVMALWGMEYTFQVGGSCFLFFFP